MVTFVGIVTLVVAFVVIVTLVITSVVLVIKVYSIERPLREQLINSMALIDFTDLLADLT